MFRLSLILLAGAARALTAAQEDAPLESVTLDGSHLAREFVLDIAGLKIGATVNPAAIEAASGRLRDTGIFESISFQYTSAPTGGYAVTLTVQDQTSMSDASIDIPGVDEAEAWKWLASRYPQFDHFVPKNDAAEEFLIKRLEEHLAPQLAGEKLVARMEADLNSGGMVVSFQPEKLPQVELIVFTGQKELTQDELASVLQKQLQGRGFTGRALQQVVELNLRRAYEDHGMYRVQLGEIVAAKGKEGGLAVTAPITEGPQYTLGKVEIVGDGMPAEAMLKAGDFHAGKMANWTEIQRGIFDSERPLKRTGYLNAASQPERILHDDAHVMDVKISYAKGPLYRFGQLRLIGLNPAQEAAARKLWKMAAGDPFDFDYVREFWPGFVKTLGPGRWGLNTKMTPGAGDHVMDLALTIKSQ